MKKVLAILAVIACCGFSANAQKSCPVPGTSQSIQVTDFDRYDSYYTVEVTNRSSKTVDFKITAIGCENMKQCVVYDQVSGGNKSKTVYFYVDDSSKKFRIDDLDIKVTGCEE